MIADAPRFGEAEAGTQTYFDRATLDRFLLAGTHAPAEASGGRCIVGGRQAVQ